MPDAISLPHGQGAQDFLELAREMFNDAYFGDIIRDGVVSRTDAGPYDPDTQQSTITLQSATCRVLWSGFTRMQLSEDLVRDAKLRYCKIGCLQPGFELRPLDRLTVDGQVFDVVQCSDFSAGLSALWDATVR